MGVRSICNEPGCTRLYSSTSRRVHRCPAHQAEHDRRENARRNAKRWRQGRTTARWIRVREAVLARDDYRCRECGGTEDLTVHLDPASGGDHYTAELDDCETLCRSCHGARDAPRASKGGWV